MATLDVRPAALQDVVRSGAWWEEREVGLKQRFVDAVERRMRQLSDHPELGLRYGRRLRRLLVREFHHGSFYRVRGDLIEVVAVLDLRRDPREITRTLGHRASP